MADEIASLKVVIEAEDRASAVINGIGTSLNGIGRAATPATRAADNVAASWQNTGSRIKAVGASIDSVTKPIQVAAVALAAGGAASAKFAIDFEDSFAGVKKTVEGTPEQLAAIKQGIIDLTTTGINGRNAIPKTTTELNELAAAGGQLGIQTENILGFTETMAQLDTATNLHGESGAQAVARFMNVTDTSQKNIDRFGSAVVDLGNNFATTEAEIVDMGLDMGATGHTIGMSTQAILGYSTALSSMGVDSAAGGSALQRIWMDMQNAVSSGGEELNAFAKISGKSADEFKKSWGKDADGAFRDFLKGLNKSEDQVGVLAQLGFNNVRDQRALMALAGDKGFSILTEAINRANTAWNENTALQTEFDAKADTTASKIQIVKNNLTEAGRSLGEVMLPTIADVTGGIANFAQGLAKMDEGSKKTAVGISATVVGVGALSKVTAGGLKAVGNFAEGIGKVRAAFSVGGVFAKAAPLMTTLGHTILPVAAALGAAAIAIEVIDKNFNFPKEMDKYADGVKNATDNLVKYNNLAAEVQELELIINNPDSSAEQIENARTRLKEIADMLGVDYSLDIECDTTELDEAIKKQQILSRTELIRNASGQLNTFKDSINDYIQWTDEIERQTANANYWNKVRDIVSNTRAEADLLRTEFDAGLFDDADPNLTGEEVYYNKLTELYKKATEAGIKFKDVGEGISDSLQEGLFLNDLAGWEDQISLYGNFDDAELERNKAKVKQFEEDIKTATDGVAQALASDIKLGDAENIKFDTEMLETYGKLMKQAKIDTDELATSYAAAMMGSTDFNAALGANGENAQAMAQHFINYKNAIGASAQETATGAALIQNGFRTIDEAVEQGALPAVVNDYISQAQKMNVPAEQIAMQASLIKQGFTDISQAADAGAMDVVNQQANELAHSLLGIPDDKRIEISAEGDVSLIDETTGKIEQIQNENVTVSVNADGSIEILNTATGEMQTLSGLGDVHIGINAEGDIAILDQANQEIATINENGEITVNGDYPGADEIQQALNDKDNVSDKDASLTVNGQYNGGADVAQAISDGQALQSIGDQTVTYTVNYVQNGNPPQQQATGTDYFGGGLAMVNDQTGIADPRELIVDHGQAFIPQGRNVILPLSRGAKVYTASQTKAIMSGMGIPRYAEGKDNSDAFTAARDDWSHYTRTHAVTTTQELEKWVEFSKQFASNEKDIADITEQIFSLTQKQTDELNDQSAAYLELHNVLGDWAAIGDDPIDAFNRVRARNMAEVEAGRMTWEDYTDTISKMGSDMYDDRISSSRNWLEREKEYHDMSLEDYIAGLERMEAYTREYYDNGIISYREYVEGIAELTDDKIDTYRDLLDAQMDASLAWTKDRTYFNDWQDYGDDPIAAYERVKERNEAALRDGKITAERYNEMMSEMGSELYQGRRESSERWLEEQKKYFGMSSEDYIAGLEREKAYTEEYYRNGLISAREYHEGMTDLNHQIWDEAASAYDDMLSQQSKYISDMREKFADEEQALRDSWDVEDRAVDMDDLEHQLAIFEGAVTDRGQEQYKSLLKQYKDAQREEELYNIQVRNNAVLEDMQADYDALENAKTDYIKGIAENTDIDVGGYVQDITTNISKSSTNTLRTLQDIITAIKNLDFKMEQQNFSDNRTVTIYSADRYDVEYMAGLGG